MRRLHGPGTAVAMTDGLIDRATPDDMVSLASETAAPMQVGAVLVLDGELDAAELTRAVQTRVLGVPRLGRRLMSAPIGCGRPVWVDDPHFDIDVHVENRPCPAPGDTAALLDAAAAVTAEPLPLDRPLWRIVALHGLEEHRSALLVVFHHVLADGIGGLAVLAHLVDGDPAGDAAPVRGDPHFPRPRPTPLRLFLDATGERVRSLTRLPATIRRIVEVAVDVRRTGIPTAEPAFFVRPTSGRHRLAVVRTDLERVVHAAHSHGATVNDVVLAAVAAALRARAGDRGRVPDRLVVSVPVSARRSTTPGDLGNRTEVMPVTVPTTGSPDRRLTDVAAATRAAKTRVGRTPASLFGPFTRLLARLRMLRWFVDHQRTVHTFVTNLRGPDQQLSFLDRRILDLLPVTLLAGNVTVAFAVMSYAGTLGVTIHGDRACWPDLDQLAEALDDELSAITATA